MAAHVDVEAGVLRVIFPGASALWTLRRHLEVPLANVVAATVERSADAQARRPRLRLPGTFVPGRITAGTYQRLGGSPRELWDARRGDRLLIIELRDERYTRVVIEVPDPDEVAAAINGVVGG